MLLEKEISSMFDPRLKEIASKLINKREDLLKNYPGSIGGKFHPSDERGPGGLVKHIKRCFKLATEVGSHFGLSAQDISILHFCALTHDISNIDISRQNEDGSIERDKEKYKSHAEISAQIVCEALLDSGEFGPTDEILLTIDGIIRSHMGCWEWYAGKRKPLNTMLETLFSAIDLISTREWVKVDV